MTSNELQFMLQSMFPGKTVTLNYDDSCVFCYEFDVFNSTLNPQQLVKYNKVLASVQDNPIPPTYYSVDLVVGNMAVADMITKIEALPINS